MIKQVFTVLLSASICLRNDRKRKVFLSTELLKLLLVTNIFIHQGETLRCHCASSVSLTHFPKCVYCSFYSGLSFHVKCITATWFACVNQPAKYLFIYMANNAICFLNMCRIKMHCFDLFYFPTNAWSYLFTKKLFKQLFLVQTYFMNGINNVSLQQQGTAFISNEQAVSFDIKDCWPWPSYDLDRVISDDPVGSWCLTNTTASFLMN